MQANEERPDADSLQFRKAEVIAEPSGPACGMCRGPVAGSYYQVSGIVCCSPCAEARLVSQQQRGGLTYFGRALLFGAGAAIAGSLLWAIIAAVTHMQFALLAIVIGIMVGKAVLYGARGCRGRRYQIAAVLLTYASITTSYIPEFISEIAQIQTRRAGPAAGAGTAPAGQHQPTQQRTAVSYIVFGVLVVGVSLVAPFLGITQGFSGLLNLLIIFFGISRAWRYTRADAAPIIGPYPIAGLTASNP